MGKNSKKYCTYCGSVITKYFSINKCAEILDMSTEFFRKKIKNREISYVKIGKSVRIPICELEKIINYIPSFNELSD